MSSERPHWNAPAMNGELWKLALLFLRLGSTAFGGPAAHISMMEDEVVRRRGWLSRNEFLDLVGITNLLPGPNSTEMALHIGWLRARWAGLFVAGISFILPAASIVTFLAWLYVQHGRAPQASGILYGVKPVVIAIVFQAIWNLGKTALTSMALASLAGIAIISDFSGCNELVILFGTGTLAAVLRGIQASPPTGEHRKLTLFAISSPFAFAFARSGLILAPVAVVPFSLWTMCFFFVKVGSVLFGSGLVLLAFLRADLVERWGWLTESQLLDAIAVGQITPGPVFTSATFIGYLLGGMTGAIVATFAIFVPAFIFVALSGPIVPAIRRSALASAFLDGVNVASLSLMAVVSWRLADAALVDFFTSVLSFVSAFCLVRYRLNSLWLRVSGATLGFLAYSGS